MNKKHRFYIASGLIYLTLGVIGLSLKTDLIEYFFIKPLFVSTVTVVLILTGMVSILFVYLQGGFSKDDENLEKKDYSIAKEIEKLKLDLLKRIEENKSITVDNNQIRDIVYSKVDKLTEESLLQQIHEKYEERLIEDYRAKALEEELYDVKKRIERESARTSRNGNLNLLIGFFTTFMAIFFLGYSLLGVDNNQENTMTFIYHFIPRLSLSLFIEFFSFFFLRIYKRNLEDIKYLNNERTNIDLKLVALRTSLLHQDDDSLKNVITELAKTDRNFVLKKGESTVELEKEKIEVKNTEKLLSTIAKILEKK